MVWAYEWQTGHKPAKLGEMTLIELVFPDSATFDSSELF